MDKTPEQIARFFSTSVVRCAVDSVLAGNWKRKPGEWSTVTPYPMGVHDNEPNRIYYAKGWGAHQDLWPWERWLLRRAILQAQENTNALPD